MLTFQNFYQALLAAKNIRAAREGEGLLNVHPLVILLLKKKSNVSMIVLGTFVSSFRITHISYLHVQCTCKYVM